jgi:hypothetical protein
MSASAKYPRIPHLPWSPGTAPDDRRMPDTTALLDRPLVITEKLDGSNLSMTSGDVFARTHAHAPRHPSFDMAKRLWAGVRGRIPEGLSVFGEWLYARHSIEYRALPGYFIVFGVRDDAAGAWRSWDQTTQFASDLGLPAAPVLWTGRVRTDGELRGHVERLARQPSEFGGDREGVVVRVAGPITDFDVSVAKWVRAGHVQTDEHWSAQPIVKNGLGPAASRPGLYGA